MGHEIRHVRIPDLAVFVSLFDDRGVDPELASSAGWLVARPEQRSRFGVTGGPFDPKRQQFADYFDEEFDGVASPHMVDLDRRFGWLHFALGRVVGVKKSVVDAAVFGTGALLVADGGGGKRSVWGLQGMEQRVSTARECKEIATVLSGVSVSDVAAVAEMPIPASVYKSTERDPSLTVADFEELRRFYAAVATDGHEVLVTRD